MESLRISPVAYQPHIAITRPQLPGASLVLRIPEFVQLADGSQKQFPVNVAWEQLACETHWRYHWDESDEVKHQWATDFSGEVRANDDEIDFTVTMKNMGDKAHEGGVALFCLQAGAYYAFHDYNGDRTFARREDGWISVHEMQSGQFEDHRMCSYRFDRDNITAGLMAKVSNDGEWVLGIALDRCGSISCNHQIWPSCIHTNPVWDKLSPGQSQTAHGKVYFFRGSVEDLYERYQKDF